MNQKLLFVNKHKTIIDEFLLAMQGMELDIDVTDSALEAVKLMSEYNYHVVITGMGLSVENGMKLLSYLNENYPHTVCIVYTTRLDLAHLNFLINERSVFRIFLHPANYKGEFYQAIVAGFDYYELMTADLSYNDRKNEEPENKEKSTDNKNNLRSHAFEDFLLPVLKVLVKESLPYLEEHEQIMVLQYEGDLIEYYTRREYHEHSGIRAVVTAIEDEFNRDVQLKINIKSMEEEGPASSEATRRLHFILWVLLHRYSMLSADLKAELEISQQEDEAIRIKAEIEIEKDNVNTQNKDESKKVITDLTRFVLKNHTHHYHEEQNGNRTIYDISFQVT